MTIARIIKTSTNLLPLPAAINNTMRHNVRLFYKDPVKVKKCYAKYAEHKDLEKIRNIGISAHIDAGKTTLTERILFYTGRIDEMHEVRGKDQVGATMDSMELERKRGITIQSAATYTLWKDHNFNIIDTPGHVDFTVEVERSLRVLDGAILVLCAVGGVQSQTLTVSRQMKRYNVPFISFINKLDRWNANPYRVLSQMRSKLNQRAALVQLPIGLEKECRGVVDLIGEQAIYFQGDQGKEMRFDEIPQEMRTESKERREELIENVAEVDDPFCLLYVDEKPISESDIKNAIKRACIKRAFTPVLVGTALQNQGIQPVLDAVIDYLPNPGERENYGLKEEKEGEEPIKVPLDPERSDKNSFVSLAFKIEIGQYGQLTYMRCYQGMLKKGDTIFNARTNKSVRVRRLVRMHANNMEDVTEVYAGDIFALFGVDCASGDTFVSDPKLGISLESMFIPEPVVSMAVTISDPTKRNNFQKGIDRYTREDQTFHCHFDSDNQETILSGMGELQLETYAQRLESIYNCPIALGKPKVSFRETLVSPCEFDYLHKKQSGGQGQYARVTGILEPLPSKKNTLLEFVDETVGTNIPKQFIPGIQKGFLEMSKKGHFCGQKLTGLKFRLLDGAHHSVDSSELAFNLAAQGAVREAFEKGVWRVLQPIMAVEVIAPVEYQGVILKNLTKRHGIINDIENNDGYCTITVEVPLNEMFGYAGDVRRISKGTADFTMVFTRYTPCLPEVQDELVEEYQRKIGILPPKNNKQTNKNQGKKSQNNPKKKKRY